jgi:hypothetical protein
MSIEIGGKAFYIADIASESWEGGFKAKIRNISRIHAKPDAEPNFEYKPFPDFFAPTRRQAEQLARGAFKAWVHFYDPRPKRPKGKP